MNGKLPISTDTFAFPIGFSLYYLNKAASLETKEFCQFFSRLSGEELLALKRGDIVWVDEEPYTPHGKFHGYTKRIVSEIEMLTRNSIRIGFKRTGSFRFSLSGFGRVIAKVNNEPALKSALDQFSHFTFIPKSALAELR